MKSRLALILVVMGSFARADVAGEYEDYVNHMLTYSRDLGRNYAFQGEMGVMVNRLSTAESYLARASQSALAMALLAEKLRRPNEPLCPTWEDGTLSLSLLSREIFLTSQVLAHFAEVSRAVAAYDRIADSLATACDDDRQFDGYRVDALGLTYYFPDKIHPLDGVYVGYVDGGAGNRAETERREAERKNEETMLYASGLISVFTVAFNLFGQNKIDELKIKLVRDTIKSPELQGLALETCRSLRDSKAKDFFAASAPLREAFKDFDDAIRPIGLENRRKALHRCLDDYEDQRIEKFRLEAKARAEQVWAKEQKELAASRRVIELHERINLRLLGLQGKNCVEGRRDALAVRADLARVAVYLSHEPSELAYAKKKRAALETWYDTCLGVKL